MSRVSDVARRYSAVDSLIKHGASIFAVGDPAGARLNESVRRTLFTLGDERAEVWEPVLQAASALRWRRMMQPQPMRFQTQQPLIDDIVRRAETLRDLVSHGSLLELIAEAAVAVGKTDSPVGALLLESIEELEPGTSVVIAGNRLARTGLASWLDDYGVTVLLPGELDLVDEAIETTYVVAPPIFMPSSVITAPATPEVTFLLPTWFRDHSMPPSTFGAYAEGRIVIDAKVHVIDDTGPSETAAADSEEITDLYVPQPIWGRPTSGDRKPTNDEVHAWKTLLAGGYYIWLDDGDRIRSLDPRKPVDERIGYESVRDVDADTYLVLREGEAERGALYDQALSTLGEKAVEVVSTQERWKARLEKQLVRVGVRSAISELDHLGVRASNQVEAWVDPLLICPQRKADFEILLDWIGEPTQPAYDNAISLRRAVYRATSDLRSELEMAAGRTDLQVLEHDGILRLDLPSEGSRGMIVARVLARAPFTEIVRRNQVRTPFKDGVVQWLE